MKKTMYSVIATAIDKKTGAISRLNIASTCATKEEAQNAMRALYFEELKSRNLEDNDANEEGESVPGGYCCDEEAGIYDYVDFAFGQLLEVFTCNIQQFEVDTLPVSIGSKVYLVGAKLRANTLGRIYRTASYEVYEGEVLAVKQESDTAFAEVFVSRDVETAYGVMRADTRIETHELGAEAFAEKADAENALKKMEKIQKEGDKDAC